MIEDYQRNFVLKIYYSTNFHKNGLLTNLVFIIKYVENYGAYIFNYKPNMC